MYPVHNTSQLFHPHRLDLAVKAKYFHQILHGRIAYNWETMYTDFILARTHGVEPKDKFSNLSPVKTTIQDYLTSCKTLLSSMQSKQFNTLYPIPISPTNLPLNGSHRLACSHVLGLSAYVTQLPQTGLTWGLDWMTEHNFNTSAKARVLRAWQEVTKSTSVFVLFEPAIAYWSEIESLIPKEQTAGYLDLDFSYLSPLAFTELVQDMYAVGEHIGKPELPHITKKLEHLRHKQNLRVVLTCELDTKRIKNEIRNKLKSTIPQDLFITCHATDTPEEANYLGSILLNPNYWFMLKVRPQLTESFSKQIKLAYNSILDEKLPAYTYCIVGGSVLNLYGLRVSDDIDITVTDAIRKDKFTEGITKLPHVDIVTKNYHRRPNLPCATDDELIQDATYHTVYRGIKFAIPRIVLDRKTTSLRTKDLPDIPLLIDFLSQGCVEANKASSLAPLIQMKPTLYVRFKKAALKRLRRLVKSQSL